MTGREQVSPARLARDRRSLRPGVDRVAPSLADPTVAQASSVIGGPVGSHAVLGRTRFLTPLRVVLALTVVFLALGWFGKAACLQQQPGPGGAPTLDWSNGRPYVAMCYSDTVPLYSAERLDQGSLPYQTSWVDGVGTAAEQVRHMEYPVVTGFYQYGATVVAKAWYAGAQAGLLPGALEVVLYFTVVALGLSVAWTVTVWGVSRLSGRRVWDAALVAISPLVAVHVFTNFDALATAAATGGMLAWARRRPVLAGVLLGLGGAAKLYPLLLLYPLLVLCVRTGTVGHWARAAGAAAAAWVVVNLPVALAFPAGWAEFFRLNTIRGADPDSLYNVVTSFTGWPGFDGTLAAGQPPAVLNAVTLALFALVSAAVAWLGLRAPVRPRVPQLALLLVAGFLLTNKVWSPQYSLWLVPLAVLAVPRVRLLLGWMFLDALVWVPRMFYYLGVDRKGLPEQWFTGAVVLRDVAVVAVCVVVVREVWQPSRDLVRSDGGTAGTVDDPAGGMLDGAPDAPPTWLPPVLRPVVAERARVAAHSRGG